LRRDDLDKGRFIAIKIYYTPYLLVSIAAVPCGREAPDNDPDNQANTVPSPSLLLGRE